MDKKDLKVICHMIVTADGFIAHPEGKTISSSLDWQEFTTMTKKHNNFVVGRNTYDVVGANGFDGTDCDYKIVVSRGKNTKIDDAFTLVNSPEEAVSFLENKVGTLLLVGGSKINTSFAKAGLIDELVIITEPYTIGKGIPLFDNPTLNLNLKLLEINLLENDRVKTHYCVSK